MSKFHINKHGVPAPCKATKGKCPLGGESQHFDSVEAAQKFANEEGEKNHGLLPGTTTATTSNLPVTNEAYESRRHTHSLELMLEDYISDKDKKEFKQYKRDNYDVDNIPWAGDSKVDYKVIDKYKIVDNKLQAALEKRGIYVDDLKSLSEVEKKALIAETDAISIRKTRNNLGFLTSDKNTSYKHDKTYTQDNLEGSFEDVYYTSRIMNNVGWHKASLQGQNDESSRLNEIMDKKSVDIASQIIKTSKANKESKQYPISGMVVAIQGLRHKGVPEEEIVNRAKNERVADMFYEEFNMKPRKVSGATELHRVLSNEAKDKNTELHQMLKNSLNWSE